MKQVLVFDVNETLLDVAALDPLFKHLFGNATVRREWFNQMLQLAFVSTITHGYRDFGDLGMTALAMVAERNGATLADDDRRALGKGMRELPPHPEVKGALERLRGSGFRMATLTNSTLDVSTEQLRNAGLNMLFEQTLSADTVQRLKPAQEPYRMAAERLGVAVRDIRLVAAHSWDIAGALNAGCAAAFVARPGQVLDPSGAQPNIVGMDVADVVERILATER